MLFLVLLLIFGGCFLALAAGLSGFSIFLSIPVAAILVAAGVRIPYGAGDENSIDRSLNNHEWFTAFGMPAVFPTLCYGAGVFLKGMG